MAEDDFKDTEIGRIPKEWKITNLSQVGKVQSGGNAPQGDNYFLDGKYPFIRVQHFDGSKRYVYKFDLINDEAIRDYGLKLYPAGSIIFPKSGASINLEKKAMLFVDSYVVSHLAIVVPKRSVIDEMFLFYYLKTVELKSMGKGSTLPYLNLSIIANIPIPIPPINEQTRIAYVLSTIQNAIEIQDKMIEALQKLKKSMMHKLFTEGIGHTEFKDTEIGRIPKEWTVKELKEITSVRKVTITPKEFANLPYVGLEHISSGKIYLKKSDDNSLVRSNKFRFYKGDVLYGKLRPYLDKAAIANFNGICSTDVLVVKTSEMISPQFIAFLMHLNTFVKLATNTMEGTNHPRTSWESISKFKIGLPLFAEQKSIIEILNSIEIKIAKESDLMRSLENLFKTILNKLMIGHIRVKDLVIPA